MNEKTNNEIYRKLLYLQSVQTFIVAFFGVLLAYVSDGFFQLFFGAFATAVLFVAIMEAREAKHHG